MIHPPRHWSTATLRELALPVEKVNPIDLGRESFRYIDIGSVDGSRHTLTDLGKLSTAEAPSRARQVVRHGDTLFSTVRPYLEKVGFVDERLDGEIASTGFCVLRPGHRVHPKFLFYFATSNQMLSQVLPYQKGVSYPAVLDREVKAAVVPLPPMEEQRQIVRALEGHLSHLDVANDYLLRAQSHLQRFRAAWDDQLVWGNNAPTKPIGMLLGEPMRNGHSARAVSGDGSGVRTLTLTAITRRSFRDRYTKMTSANPDKVQNLWLRPGDILVQRANTPELVGTSALYEGPEDWAIFPDLAIRLRADETMVRPRYMALALQTSRTHTALRGRAKGLAGSMPKIDQRAVAECEIPVPSLSAQDRILNEAEGVHEVTDQLQHEVVKSLKRSGNLRRALLSAAFSGRLTAELAGVGESPWTDRRNRRCWLDDRDLGCA